MPPNSALMRALIAIAEREAVFTERFYVILFEQRPDTRELFGAYPLAEQEEMMRETLRSMSSLLEFGSYEVAQAASPDEEKSELGWLSINLRALGVSHIEYGVTPDMYDSYRLALIDCAREVLGKQLDASAEAALDSAIRHVCNLMNAEPS